MPIIPKNRHWIVAVFLQLGIRIRYAFESYLGLKPLFSQLNAYPSPFRPKNAPKYDFITQTGFIWIWFITGILREIPIIYGIACKIGLVYILSAIHKFLSDRLIAQFKANGYTTAQREMKIPEYDWKNGNPEDFFQTFVTKPHPVILRDFMKDTDLLKELSWDTVLKKYADEDVFLTKKDIDGYAGKLKEVNDKNVYLHNSEKIFSKYPEVRDLFQYQRLEPYLHQKVGYEQIFVGRGGTGTPFHHASVYNMFYMVDGKKQWYFIDPYDTFLAYPLIIFGRAAGFMFCLFPDEYNKEAFPLFDYCPIYAAVLNPGDVLFNPPWWWHAIRNVTETTVGVASRWHTDGIAGHKFVMTEEDYDIYRIGSLFFFLGHTSWEFMHQILQSPSPRYDEHVTLREMKNRFVHKQYQMGVQGGVNVVGVTTKF